MTYQVHVQMCYRRGVNAEQHMNVVGHMAASSGPIFSPLRVYFPSLIESLESRYQAPSRCLFGFNRHVVRMTQNTIFHDIKNQMRFACLWFFSLPLN